MDKLLPCPFCGGDDIDPDASLDWEGSKGVECRGCGASVRHAETWNTRHTPEGWQLVPVEVTEEMIDASELEGDHAHGIHRHDVGGIWGGMLAAAPKWGGE